MLRRPSVFLLFIALLFTLSGMAQVETTSELWTGGKVDVGLNKKIRLATKYQYRLEGFSRKRQSFTEFSIRYKPLKWLHLRPSYRLTRRPEINANSQRYTLDLFLKGGGKAFPLRVENRMRFQWDDVINTYEQGYTLRNRFGMGYNLSKLVDPEVSGEIFFSQETFSDFRLKIGADWNLPEGFRAKTFYAYEQQLGKKSNDRTHIIGLTAIYKTRIKRKKKDAE